MKLQNEGARISKISGIALLKYYDAKGAKFQIIYILFMKKSISTNFFSITCEKEII